MIYRYLFIFLCMAVGLPSHAGDLKPFSATYTVEADKKIVANTTISLKQTGNSNWEYKSFSKPTNWFASLLGLSVTETSHLSNHDNQLRVLNYRYDQAGKTRKIHLTFDWEKMSVTNSIDGDEWTMSIPQGTTDKLSINLALVTHLSNQQSDASFPVADGGRLKYYEYKVKGKEQLKTALGNLNTIKVYRNKRGRKDKRVTIWLAPEIGYLVVKMQKRKKDGEVVSVNIQSLD